jgi:anaerobic selenocysteine-containing dehydrogenase
VRVRVSDEMRPGVVSLPHGWGHAAAAPWQKVAATQPGVSANDWTDEQRVESLVGQSILNGVPVRLRAHRGHRGQGEHGGNGDGEQRETVGFPER